MVIVGNAHIPVMTTCVSIEFVITQTLQLLCDSMTCCVMWTSVSLDICSLSCGAVSLILLVIKINGDSNHKCFNYIYTHIARYIL